jgi:hypothetical protein
MLIASVTGMTEHISLHSTERILTITLVTLFQHYRSHCNYMHLYYDELEAIADL